MPLVLQWGEKTVAAAVVAAAAVAAAVVTGTGCEGLELGREGMQLGRRCGLGEVPEVIPER